MKNLDFGKVFNVYMGLMTFVFCFAPKLIALLIALAAGLIIFGYVKKQFSFAFYKTHLWLMLLYVAYLIGIIFTENPGVASGYVENKLSFFIFPLLFSFKPNFKLRTNELLLGLVLGTTLSSVIGILNAFSLYKSGTGLFASFTSSNISPIHHPSYFAVFLLIAVAGSFWAYKEGAAFFNLKWIIPYSVFALFMFMFCLSLAGILFLFMFLSWLVLRGFYKKYGRLKFYILLVITPFILLLVFSNLPGIRDDFRNTRKAVITYFQDPIGFVRSKNGYVPGNEARLVMWTVTVRKIAEHPLGVGTGNVDDHLTASLESFGLHELAEKQYNPHNQFLQTALEIGIPGLLILLMFLISAVKVALKSRNKLLLLLIATLVFNALFESMLQRQSGIVFYSFWISFLVVYCNSPNTKIKSWA